VSAESVVVEKLQQAGLVNKRDGAAALEVFSATSKVARQRPLSALHVLYESGVRNMVDIVLFLARDSGVPLIPLSSFDPPDAYSLLLDSEFGCHKGALAFDALDATVLVAVLNPYDLDLQQEVRTALDRPCIFYLALPSDYDRTLQLLYGKKT